MQVDPIKPKFKAPGTKQLKISNDGPLSNVAFNFNLHRYNTEVALEPAGGAQLAVDVTPGRGLHSSTSVLNLSRFCN